jgi:tetratricopeptide (TPR) repeat protein
MAVVSLAGAAWFGYSQHQAQQKVQATITEKITQAQSCFATQDFACAIEQSLVATNLAPDNSVARQLLLAAQQAQEQRLQDDKIGELIGEAQRCLLQQDLECATVYLQKAEAVGVHNSQVVSFHEALSVARAQQTQSATQKQSAIDDALALANKCFTAKDYSCAVNSVDRILELDPVHAEAIALKQKIASAKEQEGALAGKISRLMADAQNCMDKKNYSCAIAKAESVLELDAGYQPATKLKGLAQETQRKLKETGFTIK